MRSVFRAVVAVTCLFALCHGARAEVRYRATELWLPDATQIGVADINNRGEIVGWIQRQEIILSSGFLHVGTSPMMLSDLKVVGDITSINNSGQYVGRSSDEGRYFRHSGNTPVTPSNYIDSLVPNLGGKITITIADSGVVVGTILNLASFRTPPNEEIDLTTDTVPMTRDIILHGVNTSGHLVGHISWPTGNSRGIFKNDSSPVSTDDAIGVFANSPGPVSSAYAINDSDVFVGHATTTNGPWHAFRHHGDGLLQPSDDLGTLESSSLARSSANDINEAGQIVGYSSWGTTQHAFLWENGVMLDLNSLIDPNFSGVLVDAAAINDLGQIVGHAVINGQTRGYLLTPVPEPSSMVLIVIGAIASGIGIRARRRASILGYVTIASASGWYHETVLRFAKHRHPTILADAF